MTKVAVVDDHPVIRHGLAAIMTGTDLDVVASVGREADLPDPGMLDLVVLDLYLDRGRPSVDTIARLRPHTHVLVMSASGQASDVVAAIRAGAGGYITKQSEAAVIVSAAQTVAAGGFTLSSELADILHAELGRSDQATSTTAVPGPRNDRDDRPKLSPREREALTWIARGFTHAQTATRMGVGKPTVDTYVERIRSKLQVGNKADLTRAAMDLLRGTEPWR